MKAQDVEKSDRPEVVQSLEGRATWPRNSLNAGDELRQVGKFLFTALALSVVFSLFASYVVALTVVPLFCAKLIKGHVGRDAGSGHAAHGNHGDSHGTEEIARFGHGAASGDEKPRGWGARFNAAFNQRFNGFLDRFDTVQARTLCRRGLTVAVIPGIFLVSLLLIPLVGLAYLPRTDPG